MKQHTHINWKTTYIRNINRNIWDAATTLPMKNPTATLLWNFLIITVPPMHKSSNTIDDNRLTNASVPPRDDIVYNAMNICMMDMKRMKYLHRMNYIWESEVVWELGNIPIIVHVKMRTLQVQVRISLSSSNHQ